MLDTNSAGPRQSDDAASAPATARLVAALTAGGDSRLAIDPLTGVSKYLCPALPAPDIICASSCTASPISAQACARVEAAYNMIMAAGSPAGQARILEQYRRTLETGLAKYFGIAGLASVTLCPSGTDAVLTTAMMIAAERPDQAITAILPSASETGTGVPLAAACRPFDGLAERPVWLPACGITTVEIPLRRADGQPRPDDEVNAAYRAAAAATRDRPLVYLTHGTKTGLVVPAAPPEGVDVVVDACQARIDPACVVAYLRRGWPVVITGSKFFGGPAFSGAVLFPTDRQSATDRYSSASDTINLGMILRWIAALDGIEAFQPVAARMAAFLRDQTAALRKGFAANPALQPICGLQPGSGSWAALPSIFTFAIRDPADHRRFLSAAELRPVYQGMAQRTILLGQPVNLGAFGGLRIAFGARDPMETRSDRLPRLFETIQHVLTSDFRRGN